MGGLGPAGCWHTAACMHCTRAHTRTGTHPLSPRRAPPAAPALPLRSCGMFLQYTLRPGASAHVHSGSAHARSDSGAGSGRQDKAVGCNLLPPLAGAHPPTPLQQHQHQHDGDAGYRRSSSAGAGSAPLLGRLWQYCQAHARDQWTEGGEAEEAGGGGSGCGGLAVGGAVGPGGCSVEQLQQWCKRWGGGRARACACACVPCKHRYRHGRARLLHAVAHVLPHASLHEHTRTLLTHSHAHAHAGPPRPPSRCACPAPGCTWAPHSCRRCVP